MIPMVYSVEGGVVRARRRRWWQAWAEGSFPPLRPADEGRWLHTGEVLVESFPTAEQLEAMKAAQASRAMG